MLVQYIYKSEPEKIKIHDTVKVWKNTYCGLKTQKEVDEIELNLFRRDKLSGLIIDYKILEDSNND